ncbi:MAG: AI-2E family transporter [Actinomycetota bacterium]|nr:AI-2E family transporter [Actinomycetota bacterium]
MTEKTEDQVRVEEPDEEAAKEPTPIWISKRTRNVLLCGVLVAFVLLLWAAPSAVIMALGGVTLALILSFPTQALSRFMPRGLAILGSFLLLIGLFVIAISFLVPVLLEQLAAFVSSIPALVNDANATLRDLVEPLEGSNLLPGTPEEFIANLNENLLGLAQDVAQGLLGGIGGFVSGTVNVGLALFGIAFISAYLLVDARRIQAAFIALAPANYRRDARELWDSLGFSLSRYLSGLGLVMFIQGALSAVALFLIGVPYALLVGAWVAITAVIPYLGAWLGAIPAVILALSVSPTKAVIVALVFFGIQQLEGNVLTPRIQGQALRIHPVLIFLAVIVGGELAGFLGIVFAVPTLAVIKVLADFFRARLRTRE